MDKIKIVLTVGSTFAIVSPQMVFAQHKPEFVDLEVGERLLESRTDDGHLRFAMCNLSAEEEEAEAAEELTGDAEVDAGLVDPVDDGTVDTATLPKKKLVIGKKGAAAEAALANENTDSAEGAVTI